MDILRQVSSWRASNLLKMRSNLLEEGVRGSALRCGSYLLAVALLIGPCCSGAQVLAGHAERSEGRLAGTNYVLEVDGTNACLELPVEILKDLTEATVEFWVKCSSNCPSAILQLRSTWARPWH